MFSKNKFCLFIASVLITLSIGRCTTVKAAPNEDSIENMITTIQSANKKATSNNKLTIMIYADADNDLEHYILQNLKQIKENYVNNPNLNVIVLIDRIPNFSNNSSILGSNFTDTRLYKLEKDSAIRLNGCTEFPEITTISNYEANMGDPHTLKKFIDYCKENYKADKYMLIITTHGGGAKNKNINKEICYDATDNNSCMYIGQISDVLTKQESVDVLVFDACLMGAAEIAYQYRPRNGSFEVKTLISSAPSVWGDGFPYDKIFSRLKSGGGDNGQPDTILGEKEKYLDPATVTNEELGALFVESQKNAAIESDIGSDQELSCYDLSKAQEVKDSVDKLAKNLSSENKKDDIEKLRGSGSDTSLMHYFDKNSKSNWIWNPYFDLYDLCNKISSGDNFSETTKSLSKDVMKNVHNMILYSFGGSAYKGFSEGNNGLSIFLPDGCNSFYYNELNVTVPYWELESWYNHQRVNDFGSTNGYGNLYWCKDGLDPKINKVGNWFELLDSWFDKNNGESGGYNHYKW